MIIQPRELWHMFQEYYEIASATLDGVYGWQREVVAILLVVVVFNFFAKWLLRKLHLRFEKQKKTWQDSFVQSMYAPLSCYTWIFAAVHSANLILPHITYDENYLQSMHVILKVAAVFAIAWFVLKWKARAIGLIILKSHRKEITLDRVRIDVIDKLITIVILFLAGMLLMDVLGLNATTLIAFGGVGGLAIAFASQEVISNFFSGLMIYLTHPFGVGDWINLPEHNLEGNVEEIGWYMTRIRTFEKRPVYIPNSIFSKIVVETPSRMSHRKFQETILLRYSDLDAVRPIINEITIMLEADPSVDQEQKIDVHLEKFGTYSLDIQVSAYILTVDSEEFSQIKQNLLFNIIEILHIHNAKIAAPLNIVDIPNGIKLNSP